MWTRKELKTGAKIAFKRNYWKCVLVSLILMILLGGGTSAGANGVRNYITGAQTETTESVITESEIPAENAHLFRTVMTVMLPFIIVMAILGVVIGLVLSLLVINIFEVGGCRFFLVNARDRAYVNELMYGFQNGNYWNTVKIQFFRKLYEFLWTLLLIIPGIIKSYEYAMIPYILADNPSISRQEAFRMSADMMRGNKWKAFVLDLSFLGWMILDGLTFGILGIFWVRPYIHATGAELYLELKKESFGNACQTFENEVY